MVTSETSPPPPSYKSTVAPTNDDVEAESIQNEMEGMVKLPHTVSMLFGIHFYRWKKSTFSIMDFKTICSIIRLPIIMFLVYFYLQHRRLYDKIFGDWESTEEFSHGLALFFMVACDLVCAILTFKHGNRINELLCHILSFIVEITGKASSSREKYLTNLKAEHKNIRWITYSILFFFVVGSLTSAINCVKDAVKMQSNPPPMIPPLEPVTDSIIAAIPFMMVSIVGLHTLRQVAYYGPIACLIHCCSGISALKDFIQNEVTFLRKNTVSDTQMEERVDTILDYVQKVYDIVEEINLRFQWVFLTAVVSLWVVMICGWFELCIWALDKPAPALMISTTVSVATNTITFYLLCAKASRITSEMRSCMVIMRDLVTVVEETPTKDPQRMEQLHHIIRMWHLEGTMQPPTISPGNFFILRKRLIPSVLTSHHIF